MPALSMPKLAPAALVFAMFAPALFAHGGIYIPPPPTEPWRGPTDVVGPTTGGPRPAGPSTGGPAAPAAPAPGGPAGPAAAPAAVPGAAGGPSGLGRGSGGGPTTGGRGGITIQPDTAAWHYWWEFNKNPYLRLRRSEQAAVQTGSDDFYLGATRKLVNATLRPTQLQARNTVLPALKRALDGTEQRDITSSGLIAMAKIGQDHPEFTLLDVFRPRLAAHDQEVRETAALAIGIAARADGESLDLLAALLADDQDGRRVSAGSVNARTRAFSAYALGLTARESRSIKVKQRVFEVLEPLIGSERMRDRNIKVAAVLGVGLLGLHSRSYSELRLREQALAGLETYFLRSLGAGEEYVQAHVPTAMARLAGRGHLRSKALFVQELNKAGGQQRGRLIRQSCVQALGQLAEAYEDEQSRDAAISRMLLELVQKDRDVMTRRYALMALANIGGAANRIALLREFDAASKTQMRPWCAMALGVLAHHDASRIGVDSLIAETLHQEFVVAKNPDLAGALAIALGLAGALEASDDLRERLRGDPSKEQMAGYVCIGLALMDAQRAAGDLHQVLRDTKFRPQLLLQAALALGKLGDQDAVNVLLERMQNRANLATLASCASALSLIGDRRSLTPLTTTLLDSEQSALSRAFSASALGGVCDRRELPWNTPISVGINYHANVETLTDQVAGVLDIL